MGWRMRRSDVVVAAVVRTERRKIQIIVRILRHMRNIAGCQLRFQIRWQKLWAQIDQPLTSHLQIPLVRVELLQQDREIFLQFRH